MTRAKGDADGGKDALASTVVSDGTALGDTAAAPASDGKHLEPGDKIGRYVVTGFLGEGGMSVVYAALDPQLDRRVAVKVLKAEAKRSDLQARLVREAHALARLSHANVVPVYDVGTADGRVFLVQEYLDGGTLGAWQKGETRPWRDVLEMYLRAGRGIAAAHAAGLVHRDFKPDNVLLGKDGSVRVVDFGLVRPSGDSDEGTAVSSSSGSGVLADSKLTQAGAIVGTPAYMAPEQHQGKPADPRSDQFSFCVALWEALHGEHPFGGKTRAEIAARASAGKIREPSDPSRAPSSIRRALERGLAAEPAARHPSMSALLAELARDPARIRRRWLIAAGAAAALIAAGVSGVLVARRGQVDPCAGAEKALAGIWDAERRRAVETAFTASKHPRAADTFRRIAPVLDERANDWVAQQRQICHARRDGSQTAALVDRGSHCLERRRQELAALTRVLAEADAQVVRFAVEAVDAQHAPAACRDEKQMMLAVAPPPPELAVTVAEARRKIDDVHARFLLGRGVRAEEEMLAIVEEAKGIAYRPLLAEAWAQLGIIRHRSGKVGALEALEEAQLAAEAARDDELSASTIPLIIEALASQGRTDEALRRARAGEAAIARLGGDDHLTARLERSIGFAHLEAGNLAASRKATERSLALDQRSGNAAGVRTSRFNLAAALANDGEYAASEKMFQELLAEDIAHFGEAHPNVATVRMRLALVARPLGKTAEALREIRAALDIFVEAFGEDSSETAGARVQLAQVLAFDGQAEEAAAQLTLAIPVLERHYGKDHNEVMDARGTFVGVLIERGDYAGAEKALGEVIASRRARGGAQPNLAVDLSNLGNILNLTGRHEDAIRACDESLAATAEWLPKDHPYAAFALVNRGDAHLALGNLDQAEKDYDRAVAIGKTVFPEGTGFYASPTTGLGRIALARKQVARAVTLLQQAMTIREAHPGDQLEHGITAFALAEALRAKGDRDAALSAADKAVEAFRKAGARGTKDLARVEVWKTAR